MVLNKVPLARKAMRRRTTASLVKKQFTFKSICHTHIRGGCVAFGNWRRSPRYKQGWTGAQRCCPHRTHSGVRAAGDLPDPDVCLSVCRTGMRKS